jgi:hypothetical protein
MAATRLPRLPRITARIALLTVATAVALTGCGDSDSSLTAIPTNSSTGTTVPTAGSTGTTSPAAPATTKQSPKQSPTKSPTKSTGKLVSSDVSQLKSLGIIMNDGVLIDVADDGLDRYLEVGEGSVDFTGTSKKDTTMMAFQPAKVPKRTDDTKNKVVIAPPFWNEDLGAGSCVNDESPGHLGLDTCEDGALDQIWEVVPAGDSGQFELHGAHTEIRVEKGLITVGDQGYVGLQTIKYGD